jgi:hypothetical protein
MATFDVRAVLMAAAFIASSANIPASAAASLVRCHAKDAVSLQNDGTLAADEVAESAKTDDWTIDIVNGNVWIGGGAGIGPVKWIVAQNGGGGNDTILLKPSNTPTDFIRIRQWTDPMVGRPDGSPILFVRYDLSTLVSGTCEPVQ